MLISFACFTLIVGKPLTVPIAFTSLALFALVRSPMAVLPMSITQLLQSKLSLILWRKQRKELTRACSQLMYRFNDSNNSLRSPKLIVGFQHSRKKERFLRRLNSTTSGSNEARSSIVKKLLRRITLLELVRRNLLMVERRKRSNLNSSWEISTSRFLLANSHLFLVLLGLGNHPCSWLYLAVSLSALKHLLACWIDVAHLNLTEMTCLSGEIHLRKGTPGLNLDSSTGLYDGVAYAAQLPWLQHASIRNVSLLPLSSTDSLADSDRKSDRISSSARLMSRVGMKLQLKRARWNRISICLMRGMKRVSLFLSLFLSLVEIVADKPSPCCRDRRERYLVCSISLTLEYACQLANLSGKSLIQTLRWSER